MALNSEKPERPTEPPPAESSKPPLRPSDEIPAVSLSIFIPETRGANPEFNPRED